ncbi:MAG TPA: ammonium transporter [Gemmataceae bacterium]|nr:ammonium transporter [Gemmataceae bacterium]
MKPSLLALLVALFFVSGSAVFADTPPETTPPSTSTAPAPTELKIDSGDTAWMLTSTGLVMLMTPGLALFYGGMVRRKNILGTMMHSMVALAVIGILWVLYGYALAFGDTNNGLIGWKSAFLGLQGVASGEPFPGTKIPIFVHCMYQGMFAIITPALISGALAERIKFGPYCLFLVLWGTLVYAPLAHWVWAVNSEGKPVGWLGAMGALDFAGGTVVHIAAGVSGLAAILVLRKRIGYPEHAIHPNSMVLTLTGAGLLWFGWFGFNGGSSLHADQVAASALTATQIAAAAAALSWLLAEWIHRGKPTALGLASGLVAGLVAVTPASGYVTPLGGMTIGLLAGVVCYAVVCLKPVFKYDDSLDAFGVHGVGGFLGALLTGLLCSKAINGAGADGSAIQFTIQLKAALVSVVFAFAVTYILVKAIDSLWGFCLEPQAENEGLDRNQHGEVGFDSALAYEQVPESPPTEPRPAMAPPNGAGRFTVILDGSNPRDLRETWSDLCQSGPQPVPAELRTVYPFVTTVQGNRFHFRGGDPAAMSASLTRLFEGRLHGQKIQARVES